MNRIIIALLISISTPLLLQCLSKSIIPYNISSGPTESIDRIKEYFKVTSKLVQFNDRREIIFHRAGSLYEFAKNINRSNYCKNKCNTKDVVELMDMSFEILKGDRIEFDVRTAPASNEFPDVYAVHDEIEKKLNQAAKDYLKRNSLTIILKHYIKKKYYEKGKSLVVELKVAKGYFRMRHHPLTDKQKKYIRAVTGRINEVVRSQKDQGVQKQLRKSIFLASFNIYALEYANKMIDSGHGFVFLACSNIWYSFFIVLTHRDFNLFDSKLQQKVIDADWLTGIWVSPRAVRRIATTLNRINDKRDKKLDYYLAVYFEPRDMFYENLQERDKNGNIVKLKNVGGLIFDIKTVRRNK